MKFNNKKNEKSSIKKDNNVNKNKKKKISLKDKIKTPSCWYKYSTSKCFCQLYSIYFIRKYFIIFFLFI